MKHLLFVLALPLLWYCDRPSDPVPLEPTPDAYDTIPNTLDQVINDMALPHEARPSGVTHDWATAPRVSYGNETPADWTAMITWGQVYRAAGADTVENVRILIGSMRSWYLSKASGEWERWQQSTEVEGANYAEDFQNDENVPADIRRESAGYSATLREGYNFHFWPAEGRVNIDPADIAGVWSAIDARLILDDPNGPDNRAEARLLMSAGADYWESRGAQWDQWKTNGDIGIGRFRFLTRDWQTFNMHTLTEAELRDNPPPLDE